MSSTHIIYISLRLLMLLLLYIGGSRMAKAKTSRQYWKCAILPILAFTLNEGLRFGRGVDYNSYYRAYHYVIDGDPLADGFEPFFKLLILIFGKVLGLEWQYFVAFMSFLLIFAAVLYFKQYKKYVAFALPLFAIMVVQAENVMRWFLAFSFALIGIAMFQNHKLNTTKRWIWLMAFFLLGFLTHYGFIIVEVIYLVFLLRKSIFMNPWVFLPIFGLIALFGSTKILANFDFIALQANIFTTRFEQYSVNAVQWLTGKGDDMFYGMALWQYAVGVYMLLEGARRVKYDSTLATPYNLALVGLIASPILLKLELGLRVVGVLSVFQSVVLASCFKKSLKVGWINRFSIITKVLPLLIMLNYARMEVQGPLNKQDYMFLYVWDAKGRKYLDTSVYY